MRLTRFLIASLFIFFFAFGIHTQALAQVPANCVPHSNPTGPNGQPDPLYPVYVSCTQGGAGAFYGNLAQCQQATCQSAYTPGAFAKAPPTIIQMLNATLQQATSGKQSSQAFEGGVPMTVNAEEKACSSMFCSAEAHFIVSLGGIKTQMTALNAEGKPENYYVQVGGVTDATIGYVAKLYNKPASTGEYMQYVAQSIQNPFGAQPAYAQGLGFSALSPVLELWKLFRNLAYFFFVIIFLVIGFLIMFRSKIGGQAAVTVQQALPKIIVSLLLVTFSYAIAGLLIDIMYLVMYLIIGIFTGLFPGGQINSGGVPQSLSDVAFRNDIFTNGIKLTSLSSNISESMGRIVANILVNLGWNTTVAGVVTFGASLIFMLILIVAIIVSLFRVFFALLQAYLGIFFSVIFAPIQLLLGALPGQNTFGSWLKGLLENLMVFPVLVLLIFIAYYIARGGQVANSGGFSAPQLGSNQGGGFAYYQDLLALGAILAMPEVLKLTKGIMKGKIDVSPKDLVNKLAAGNEYAAPAIGVAGGAISGAALGAYYGRRSGEGVLSGIWSGAKDARGNDRGGLRRNIPSGWSKGLTVSKTIDRLRDGQLFDPDNVSKQLDKLTKVTEAQNKGGSGGKGSSSSNSNPLPFSDDDWGN